MRPDLSIGHWLSEPPAAPTVMEPLPAVIREVRPLAEAYRLDVALFVAVGEVSVRIAGSLMRHAPDGDCLNLCVQQAAEDARHCEQFRVRLEEALAAAPARAAAAEAAVLRLLQGIKAPASQPLSVADITTAVVIPPLRRFFDRCRAAADAGSFAEGLALLHLTLKAMALPVYEFEVRYWQPVDPGLAHLIRAVANVERRHLTDARRLICCLLAELPHRRTRVAALCAEARKELDEVFSYFVRKLVTLFAVAAQQHPECFVDTEIAPGKLLRATSVEEQEAIIHAARHAQLTDFLTPSGIGNDGQQESIPHG
jgi:hypothetical protein